MPTDFETEKYRFGAKDHSCRLTSLASRSTHAPRNAPWLSTLCLRTTAALKSKDGTMKSLKLALISFALVMSAAACGGKHPAVAVAEKYATDACACKDTDCATKVTEE